MSTRQSQEVLFRIIIFMGVFQVKKRFLAWLSTLVLLSGLVLPAVGGMALANDLAPVESGAPTEVVEPTQPADESGTAIKDEDPSAPGDEDVTPALPRQELPAGGFSVMAAGGCNTNDGHWSLSGSGAYVSGQTVFTYTLTEQPGPGGNPCGVSHINIKLPSCAAWGTITDSNWSPTGSFVSHDGSTGDTDVWQWTSGSNGSTFKLTLDGYWLLNGSLNWTIKAGNNADNPDRGTASGLSCTQATPQFTVAKTVSAQNDPATGTDSLTIWGSGTAYYFYTVENTGAIPITITAASDDKEGTVLGPLPKTLNAGQSATASVTRGFAAAPGAPVPANQRPWTNTVSVTANGDIKTASADVTVKSLPLLEASCGSSFDKIAWKVTNGNDFAMPLDWQLVDTDQSGTKTAGAGDSATWETTKVAGTNKMTLSMTGMPDVEATFSESCSHPKLTVKKEVSFSPDGGWAPSLTIDPADTNVTVYFQYTVTNTGNTTLTLEPGDDDVLGPVTWAKDTLAVGESTTGSRSQTFPALTGDDPEKVTPNTVTVKGWTPDEGSVTAEAVAEVTQVPPPKRSAFTLTKLVTDNSDALGDSSLDLSAAGGTVYYHYTIVNEGNTALTITSAEDTVEGTVTFSPNPVPVGGTATAMISRDFGPLVAGDQNRIVTNTVVVEANGVTHDATATVTQVAPPVVPPPVTPPGGGGGGGGFVNFTVTKHVGLNPNTDSGETALTLAGSGGTVYYYYTVTNTGTLPFTITSAVDDKLGAVPLSATSLAPGQSATGTLSTQLPALAAGAPVNVVTNTFSVKVNGATKSASATVTQTAPTEIPPTTPPATPPTTKPPTTQSLTPKPLVGSLEVRVLDNSSRNGGTPKPIAGAQVRVTGGLVGTTDADGFVLFPNLFLGTYHADGSAVDPRNPIAASLQAGSATATLTEAEPDQTVTILLAWADSPTAPPTTSVVPAALGSISGRVCSPKAPGAQVSAVGPNGETAGVAIASNGVLGQWRPWTLADLVPGTWTLKLQAPDGQVVEQKVTVTAGAVAASTDFSLACTGSAAPLPWYWAGGALILTGTAFFIRRRRGVRVAR